MSTLGARSQAQLELDTSAQRRDPESEKAKLEARERIKAKFRSRRAERLKQDPFGSEISLSTSIGANSAAGLSYSQRKRMATAAGGNAARLAGEEMYQHLDFYERSLNAVVRQQTQ